MPVRWAWYRGARRASHPLLLAVVAAALGCDESTVCPADLRVHVTPAERTIAVGESFTPTAEALGCGGTQRLPETWVWATADTGVVAVDSLTGRTTGRVPGAAAVRARGLTYGPSGASVRVTVQ